MYLKLVPENFLCELSMSESVQIQFKTAVRTCSQAVGAIKSDLSTDSINKWFAMFWKGVELPTEGKLVQKQFLTC